MRQDYAKIKTAIRYWMLGRGMFLAHDAMELGLQYHVKLRKDGVTPEFQHQVSQANYARTLIDSLMYPQETLAAIFLHDLVEDYDVHIQTIYDRFGPLVGGAVEKLTNHANGTAKPKDVYFPTMVECPIASFVKGCDRMHNFQSMPEVFTSEKQLRYIEETEKYILPMLKEARKRYPKQEPAYQNVKYVLRSQIEMLEIINKV